MNKAEAKMHSKNEAAISLRQSQLRAEYQPLIRDLISGRFPDSQIGAIIEKMAGIKYYKTQVTFDNTLPLLTHICSILALRNNWRRFAADNFLSQAAMEACQDALDRFDQSGFDKDFYYYIVKGIISTAARDVFHADAMFKLAKSEFTKESIFSENHIIPALRGALNTVSQRDIWKYIEEDAEVLPLSMVRQAEGSASFVVIAAADVAYVRRFGRQFIESCLQASPTGICHLHIAMPEDVGAHDCIGMLGGSALNSRLSLSLGPDMSSTQKDNRIAYYTMVRYFYLEQIARTYNLPAFVTDIDMRFVGGWETHAELFAKRGYQVGLRTTQRLARCMPWLSRLAGALYVSCDPAGAGFRRALTAVAQKSFSAPNMTKYNIDQNVLSSTVDFFQFRNPSFIRAELTVGGAVPARSVDKRDFPES